MTKTILVSTFEFGTLEFIWYLACLREAPPCGAEAGAWNLVFPYGYALFAMPYALLSPPEPRSVNGDEWWFRIDSESCRFSVSRSPALWRG